MRKKLQQRQSDQYTATKIIESNDSQLISAFFNSVHTKLVPH